MTKRRALVVTTVASTIDQFCMNDIYLLQKKYEVQIAANFTTGNNTCRNRIDEFRNELQSQNIVINEVEFSRNPLSISNVRAYKKIVKLILRNDYDLIHCHTPVAAMFTRLAARKLNKNGTEIMYTAHGFHFFKGAPLKNWLVYYPIEKWLSRYTNTIITINYEDYERAKNKFNTPLVKYIPGVGVDINKFNSIKVDRNIKLSELQLPSEATIILSVGELNDNKNHKVILEAIAQIDNPKVHYIICGQGQLDGYLNELSDRLGISDQVHLLGFRKDVVEICKVSDLFVFPSMREGLSVALMEAMANGLPIVCSKIRGNIDLVEEGKGGYLVDPTDVTGFKKNIEILMTDEDLRNEFSEFNIKKIKNYSIDNILAEMGKIYNV